MSLQQQVAEPMRSDWGVTLVRRHGQIATLSAAFACTLIFFLPRAMSPWVWFYDENGALYGFIGSNYYRTGLAATRGGAQHWTSFDGPVPMPEYYSTHPPLFPWLCGLAQWLLGTHPFAVRLVPTLGQLGSLIPLFLIGRRLFGPEAAGWGTLLYATLPMCAYFGYAVCYESLNNMFILWAVYFYMRCEQERWSWRLASFVSLALLAGMWTDWPAYFVAMGIGLDWLLRERGWCRLRALVPWGTGLVSFALFTAFIYQLGGTGGGGLGSLLNAMKNRTGISPDETYTLAQFAKFIALQNVQLYGLGIAFLVAGLCIIRDGRVWRPLLVLLATATLHVALFSYGAMTHEYWTFYFVGPVSLSAMALFARWHQSAVAAPLFLTASLLLIVQSALVIADYSTGYYRQWATAHIILGKTISTQARDGEVVLMSFGWGDGAIVAYYAGRPIVRVGSVAELERIRRHPHFVGGYLVKTWNLIEGERAEWLDSLECIGETELQGDRMRVLKVPPDRESGVGTHGA